MNLIQNRMIRKASAEDIVKLINQATGLNYAISGNDFEATGELDVAYVAKTGNNQLDAEISKATKGKMKVKFTSVIGKYDNTLPIDQEGNFIVKKNVVLYIDSKQVYSYFEDFDGRVFDFNKAVSFAKPNIKSSRFNEVFIEYLVNSGIVTQENADEYLKNQELLISA